MTDERLMTPFGFASAADEVLADVDLSGQRAVVTGAASGIGVETARALASVGAAVVLAVRRPEAAERVAAEITESTGNKAVTVRQLDLADQRSVTEFVDGWEGPLHILVNNAGVMALPELTRTREGWEMQFATNFVGHFALTVGLHDALTAASGARIVSLSSTAHLSSPVINTCTFVFGPTTHEPLTRSRRLPRLSSQLRRPGAGRLRGSTPTRSIQVLSPRDYSSTPAAL
jgi:NAD(P)-dependent dehydrogenase (short-subunit alcohol dehydrogenase family)